VVAFAYTDAIFGVFNMPPSAKRRAPPTSRALKRRKPSSQHLSPSPPSPPPPLSPLSPPAIVSQATTFETQLLESQIEADITALPDGSELGTAATTEAGDGDRDDDTGDNFDGIDWARLRGFIKPLTT
jgi:hypothetical protein